MWYSYLEFIVEILVKMNGDRLPKGLEGQGPA